MSIWSVIGSRCLPSSWESRVGRSSISFCRTGIGSVRAAPWAPISRRCVPWSVMGIPLVRGLRYFCRGDMSLVPSSCVPWLSRFAALGGEIVEGSASESSSRREVVAALLIRNCALVRASVGVVAFVSGYSAGSWFTVGQAIRRDLAVVVFPVDGPSGLHYFVGGSWVPCRSLAGAYVFTYFEKE